MSSAFDGSVDALYKRLYRNGIHGTVYGKKSRILLNWLKKVQGGKYISWAVTYGDPSGVSGTFADAKTQGETVGAGTQEAQFIATTADLFGYHTISDKAILEGKTDAQAFVNTQKHQIDQIINQISNVTETNLIGDGYGTFGTVSALPGGNVITLTSRYDIKDVQINSVLRANTAGPTGATRAGTMIVTAVDRTAGTITCGGGTVAGLAVGDALLFRGNSNGSTTRKAMAGLKATIPDTVSGSDSFHGVNRSVDRVRLAGVPLDRSGSTGGSLDEHLTDFLALMKDVTEAEPDLLLMSATRAAELSKIAQSKCEIDLVEVKNRDVTMGFQVMKYAGPGFTSDIVVHPKIGDGRVYALTTDTWEIAHLDSDVVNVNTLDGKRTTRQENDPGQSIRLHVYAQPICRNPGENGVLLLP